MIDLRNVRFPPPKADVSETPLGWTPSGLLACSSEVIRDA